MKKTEVLIREIKSEDKEWIRNLLTKRWHSPLIVTRGKIHNALELPGFVAEIENKAVGLLIYRIENDEWEIISLDAIEQGRGVGSSLLSSVINKAKNENRIRLWLITTNDNLKAQEFYKNKGFKVSAVYVNAIERSRKLKPEIPLIGESGIPIKDEIEMELKLQ